MDTLLQIAMLIGWVFAGMAIAKIKLAPNPAVVDVILQVVLWILLFSMGYKLGINQEVFAKAGRMLLLAAAVSALSVIGTVVMIVILDRLYSKKNKTTKTALTDKNIHALSFKQIRGPLILIGIVFLGIISGLLFKTGFLEFLAQNTSYILYALLFVIGIQLVQSGHSISSALLRVETILVPLGTIIGTMLAGIVAGLLFSIGVGKGLALSCGFGWYSLSGVLITSMGDELLGMTAFIANMFRETLALILIPILAHTRMPYTAIGVGGATAMDVTLPLIEKSLGVDAVPVSFASGVVLSMLVPVLVPFFFKL